MSESVCLCGEGKLEAVEGLWGYMYVLYRSGLIEEYFIYWLR